MCWAIWHYIQELLSFLGINIVFFLHPQHLCQTFRWVQDTVSRLRCWNLFGTWSQPPSGVLDKSVQSFVTISPTRCFFYTWRTYPPKWRHLISEALNSPQHFLWGIRRKASHEQDAKESQVELGEERRTKHFFNRTRKTRMGALGNNQECRQQPFYWGQILQNMKFPWLKSAVSPPTSFLPYKCL